MADINRSYSTLGELEKDTKRREIVVRLVRKWEARIPRRGSQFLTMDVLLLDEKGTLIKASINNRLIQYYNNILQEGSVYHISNFHVLLSSRRFKLTDHKYFIQFTHRTILSEVLVAAPSIPKTKFIIHSYDSLLKLANTNQSLPDVVGRLSFVWGSRLRSFDSTNKIMARIVLKDGTKVRLSIWNHIASDFRILLSATKRKKCVVLITAVNPKLFDGDLYLNTSPATKYFAYSDLEDLENVSQQIKEYQNSPLDEHDFDDQDSSVKTISQLLSFLDVEEPQEREFFCSARIVDIITRKGWYHISCSRCYNQIRMMNDKLICPNCDNLNFAGIIRYRLEVIVDDETDQGRLIIFDNEAKKLTNLEAEDVVTFNNVLLSTRTESCLHV